MAYMLQLCRDRFSGTVDIYTGRSEMKKETLNNLDSLIIDIRKRNDETVLNEYMKVKRMIESL